MASEVEVNVVPPHDRQDLLPGRRDPTVAPARVAREVAEDNLPGILPRLGELAVQQLFLGLGVVDVVVDGDSVHRSKHYRGIKDTSNTSICECHSNTERYFQSQK